MIEWQKRYRRQGLVIFAISKDTPSTLKDTARSLGITYTLARWEKQPPKPFSLVPSYPAALLIDRQGRLRGGVFGPWLMQLEKELLASLKEAPPPEGAPRAEKGKTTNPPSSARAR